MLSNYLNTSIRSLRRHPGANLLNIVGLSIGMASFILIMLFVRAELEYDRFHENADRIYRINRLETLDGVDPEHVAITSGMIGPTLEHDLPEVEESVRVLRWFDPMPMAVGETILKVDDVLFADASLFDVFSFQLLEGDPGSALIDPQSIVLTRALAEKLFGDVSPIGQTLIGLNDYQYTVTGIIADAPVSSHLRYNAVISWSTTVPGEGALQFEWLNRWLTSSMYTFVLLVEGPDPADFGSKLPGFLERNYPQGSSKYILYPQPLTDIHLGSSHIQYQEGADLGNRTYVYIFSLSALLILLIACINFINAKTAIADDRAREVGVRKALGAARVQLRRQFLGESVLLSLIAFVVAVAMVELSLPMAETIVGKEIGTGLLADASALAIGLAVAVGVGVLAGLYPAMILSRFRPVSVLRGSGTTASVKIGGAYLRRFLVGAQFAISTILLSGSAIVIQQTDYLRNLDVGIDKEQVVVLPISDTSIRDQFEAFRSEVLEHPGVLLASGSDWTPGEAAATYGILPEGRPESEDWIVQLVHLADFDFAETYGMKLASGRFFDARFATDSTKAVVINETLAQSLGWGSEDAVGKRLDVPGELDESYVIGVLKDFNLRSAQYAISPVVFISQNRPDNLSVRVSPDRVDEILAHLKASWEEFESRYPFEYRFVDDTFGAMYADQAQLSRVLSVFAFLAILVACLGLFGLTSLLATKRTKEIGIRKTLGASVASILALLTGEIVRLVVVATIISVPLALLLANHWLEGFAYRIEPSLVIFAGIAGAMTAVGVLAVSLQSVRAALADPVDALRYE